MNKFFIFCICLVSFNLSFGKTNLSKEDVEILKLEKQIKILNNKIEILKKSKKTKTLNEQAKVALVLSGGGAKGFAHIGALKVLEKNNIKIDYIIGSSIGALIGTMYSIGYTPDEIENCLLNFDWNDSFNKDNPNRTDIPLEERLNNNNYAFSIKYDSNLNFYFPKSLKNSQKNYLQLKKIFQRVDNVKNFDDLPIPVRIVATNLDTGETKAFKEGDLSKAVLASTAIPSIFPSVKIDDYHYVDGLVTRNFPVENAIDMGATKIIGVNVGAYISKKTKEKYNIVTTAEQILSIQSASSTEFQKKLATILIEPDLSKYSSTDYKDAKEIVDLGILAAEEKTNVLKTLPKKSKEHTPKPVINDKTILIKKSNIYGIENPYKLAIIKSILVPYENREITIPDLNRLSMRLYGLGFVDKVFYSQDKDILNLYIEESPSNTLGVTFNYRSDYYTKLKIATDLKSFGKFGSNSNIYLKAGDYLGLGIQNLFYYGLDNKFGLSVGLNYDESPLFLYNKNHREATFKNKTINFDMNINTHLKNEILVSYGITVKSKNLDNSIGSCNYQDILDSNVDNYGQGYLKFLWDKADAIYYPKKGFIGEASYFWGGGFEKNSSDFFGSTVSLSNFIPVNKKISILTSFSASSVEGSKIPIDEYLKLGGNFTNLNKKEFSFTGYNPQEKFLEDLILFKLGIQYEFVPNLFLTGEYNIATFKEYDYFSDSSTENNQELWEDYLQGFGVSLGYLSPIGPISLSVSHNDDRKEFIYQLSIGYIID
ncbi:patatin-like phospholipase family protein [Fusobacterium sp. MFO224]|uniref:patatin-like phospholipase family protein n=1 Tax=Fusobacterium sp. MFO224 TaxID=3378070 RepID=UPI003852913B